MAIHKNGTMRTHQNVKCNFTLKFDKNTTINRKNAIQLDDDIAEALYECFNGEDFDDIDYEIEDGSFEDNSDIFEADEEYEIEMTIRFAVTVYGKYTFYPGRYSGPMEDCFPDEEDFEETSGFIDSVNISSFTKKLKLIKPIGEYIQEGSIKTYVDNFDYTEIDVDDDGPDEDYLYDRYKDDF